MTHKLTFLRIATKLNDGNKGLLYRHSWATGFEDIIFESQEDAANFLYNVDKFGQCDPDNNAGEAIELYNQK